MKNWVAMIMGIILGLIVAGTLAAIGVYTLGVFAGVLK